MGRLRSSAGVVCVGDVAPTMATPSRYHWYVTDVGVGTQCRVAWAVSPAYIAPVISGAVPVKRPVTLSSRFAERAPPTTPEVARAVMSATTCAGVHVGWS